MCFPDSDVGVEVVLPSFRTEVKFTEEPSQETRTPNKQDQGKCEERREGVRRNFFNYEAIPLQLFDGHNDGNYRNVGADQGVTSLRE